MRTHVVSRRCGFGCVESDVQVGGRLSRTAGTYKVEANLVGGRLGLVAHSVGEEP